MSAETTPGVIPSPESFVKSGLGGAPSWLRRSLLNVLAAVTWIGLPSTVLSALGDVHKLIAGLLWLYQHSGAVQPVLLAIGHAISLVVQLWRSLTHPIWHVIAQWLHLSLPSWAPDALTLGGLIVIGTVRRVLRATWGGTLSGGLMLRGIEPGRFAPEGYIALPRHFPYEQHFADNDVKWTPRRLRDAERLWRRWRNLNIRTVFTLHPDSKWPVFDARVVRAQFGRYWLAVMDGRRDMRIYFSLALVALLAIAIWSRWSLRRLSQSAPLSL